MNYIAALGGHRPRPVRRSFAYCALGCGDGLSLVLFAAANPHARFVGMDQDKSCIAATRELAAQCGLTNLALIEASVGQAVRKEMPLFDFIAARGQWSWAGDKARTELVAFLERGLKPGGLFVRRPDALQRLEELLASDPQRAAGDSSRPTGGRNISAASRAALARPGWASPAPGRRR